MEIYRESLPAGRVPGGRISITFPEADIDACAYLALQVWIRDVVGVGPGVGCELIAWKSGGESETFVGGAAVWVDGMEWPSRNGRAMTFLGVFKLPVGFPSDYIVWFADEGWLDLERAVAPVIGVPVSGMLSTRHAPEGVRSTLDARYSGVHIKASVCASLPLGADVALEQLRVDYPAFSEATREEAVARFNMSRVGGLAVVGSEVVLDGNGNEIEWDGSGEYLAQLLMPGLCGLDYPWESGAASVVYVGGAARSYWQFL